MILEPTKKGYKVFVDEDEYKTYIKHATQYDERAGLASRIMGRSSPRIGITAELKRGDFVLPARDSIKIAFVILSGTKDTTEGETVADGDWRISWVPISLYHDIQDYCDRNGIGENDQLFPDVQEKRLRDIIKEAGSYTARQTGKEGYKHITPHDMRRYFATHMLRREGVNIDIVMAMGGWENRKSMEPYLRTPLEKDIQTELAKAGVLEVDIDHEPKSWKQKIEKRLRRIENALRVHESPIDLGDLTPSEIDSLIKKVKEEQNGENSKVDKFDLDQPLITGYSETNDTKTQCLNFLNAIPLLGVWLYPRTKNEFIKKSEEMGDDPELINPNTPRGVLRFCMCSILFGVMSLIMLTLGFSLLEIAGITITAVVISIIYTDVNPERGEQPVTMQR